MARNPVSNLDAEDPNIRRQAVVDIGVMGPKAKDMVPALIKAFREEKSQNVQVFMIRAFGRIGPDAGRAEPVLKQRLEEEEELWIRFEILSALVGIGVNEEYVMSVLMDAAENADKDSRIRAIEILGKAGRYDETVIPVLINALHDGTVSTYAADSLGTIGETVIPYVSESYSGLDYNSRNRVAQALGKIGAPAVPYLIELLKSNNRTKQSLAADTIRRIGKEAEETVPYLAALLDDDDEAMINKVSLALASAGKTSLPAVVEMLGEGNRINVLKAAVNYLKYYGPEGGKRYSYGLRYRSFSAPVTIELVKTNGRRYRNTPESEIPDLLDMLDNTNEDNRKSAILALSTLGKVHEEVVSALVGLLNDGNEDIRLEALFSLIVIRPDDSVLYPILKKACYDDSPTIRSAAISFIGEMDNEKSEVLSIIKDALKDEDPIIRWCAALSIGNMSIDREELRPEFVKVMKERMSEEN